MNRVNGRANRWIHTTNVMTMLNLTRLPSVSVVFIMYIIMQLKPFMKPTSGTTRLERNRDP